MTAHKIGELSLGSQSWRLPLCPQITPPFLLFGRKSNGCPNRHFALPLVFFSPAFESGPCYELFPESVTGVIESALSSLSHSQTLMDVKLNEVWVLVIRMSLCEIYHQRLKRLQGTIKAPPLSTLQWTVHYYSLKQNAFNMFRFPCEEKKCIGTFLMNKKTVTLSFYNTLSLVQLGIRLKKNR